MKTLTIIFIVHYFNVLVTSIYIPCGVTEVQTQTTHEIKRIKRGLPVQDDKENNGLTPNIIAEVSATTVKSTKDESIDNPYNYSEEIDNGEDIYYSEDDNVPASPYNPGSGFRRGFGVSKGRRRRPGNRNKLQPRRGRRPTSGRRVSNRKSRRPRMRPRGRGGRIRRISMIRG